MNFDQFGKQHVSRRRKPSPLRTARRSPASFDASFSQNVWKRPRNGAEGSYSPGRQDYSSPGRRKKGSKFSLPLTSARNIALAAGLFIIAVVGINWESISNRQKSPKITINSLEDPGTPLEYREAAFESVIFRDFSAVEAEEIPVPALEDTPLNLTQTFSWSEYSVRQGDTISGIASRHGVSMESIIAFNALTEAWHIRPGKTLKIPNMDGIPYTVQKNDTLSKIAVKMKTPQNAILDANNMISDTIRQGEVLFIPGGRMNSNEFSRAIKRDAAVQKTAQKIMIFPVPGKITSGYGWRLDPVNPQSGVMRFHQAIDQIGNTGDPVVAAMKGKVEVINHNPNLGNFMILGHDGYQTLYAHLSGYSVKTGDVVEQGQEIAKVGNTGYTTNPHLHFEVFKGGKRINPMDVLK